MQTCFARLTGRLVVLALIAAATGCAPSGFLRTSKPQWTSVWFRPGLSRDQAWALIVNTLGRVCRRCVAFALSWPDAFCVVVVQAKKFGRSSIAAAFFGHELPDGFALFDLVGWDFGH